MWWGGGRGREYRSEGRRGCERGSGGGVSNGMEWGKCVRRWWNAAEVHRSAHAGSAAPLPAHRSRQPVPCIACTHLRQLPQAVERVNVGRGEALVPAGGWAAEEEEDVTVRPRAEGTAQATHTPSHHTPCPLWAGYVAHTTTASSSSTPPTPLHPHRIPPHHPRRPLAAPPHRIIES